MKMRILFLLGFIFSCRFANAQWVQVGPGSNVGNLVVKDSFLFALSSGTVFRTSDNGLSWARGAPVSSTNPYIGSLAVSDMNIFVATTDGGIFRSNDNAQSWSYMGHIGLPVISIIISFGGDIFAGLDGGVFRSVDSAKTWQKKDSGMPQNPCVYCFAVSGTTLYAGISGGIFFSNDSGVRWTKMNTGISDLDIFCLGISGANFYAGAGGSGLFHSTDNGTHWAATDLTGFVIYSFAFSGTSVFTSTEFKGINVSTDNGTNWTEENTGLPSGHASLVVFHDYLFASVNGGVWRRPLSEMIPAAVPSSNQPTASHLDQNYPNPFSVSTTIRFDITERAAVALKVYDITGREVAVLASETMDAGSYARTFNAEGLPSGTYVCKLEAGGYQEERTLFLLR